MTGGALIWFVVFVLSAALFFGIALVVTLRGLGDIRDLLGDEKEMDRRSGT